MDAFRSILKDKGIAGFYRGLVPSVQRAGMNSGAGLASYDHIKQYLLTNTSFQDNTTTHSLTSVFSALCSTTCALPFDIIKTRIMNQSLTNPIYKNSFHCFTMTIQKEGILSMWKGFLPTYARVFPWQFLFFVSYEQFSKYLLGGGL
jgi:solute carrier family 25 uncoupling protein 27